MLLITLGSLKAGVQEFQHAKTCSLWGRIGVEASPEMRKTIQDFCTSSIMRWQKIQKRA